MATLYIVGTPIGNLGDITARALETFRTVDVIAAEDTRHTLQLLSHFEIRKPLVSCRSQNEEFASEKIIKMLDDGQNIAYASDAGTPGVSDPGFLVAREAIRAGVEVIALPGATALVPALVSSGLPSDRFCFEGFLPQKKGRQTRLQALAGETRTMVFYESPHRVAKTLAQFIEVFGPDRQVSVCREISKIHEESVRGTLQEVLRHFTETEPRGEFVIVVGGAPL